MPTAYATPPLVTADDWLELTLADCTMLSTINNGPAAVMYRASNTKPTEAAGHHEIAAGSGLDGLMTEVFRGVTAARVWARTPAGFATVSFLAD